MADPVGFDLDMTLIDSRPQILDAYSALAEETGTVIDLGQVSVRLGLKLEDELRHWFAPDAVPEAAAIYRRHYVELAAASVALPGARQTLARLQAAGVPVIIVTAKHALTVGVCLRAAGLSAAQVFSYVHGPEKAEVLRRNSASAYVGDTPDDMHAASSAGAIGIGVTTGSYSESQLRRAGASIVLASLEDFPHTTFTGSTE